MAATEGRLIPRASLVVMLGAWGACGAGAGEDGLFVADAGSPFGFGKHTFPASDSDEKDGGDRASPAARLCRRTDLFAARVLPAFMKDCARCHNGTKGKATRRLNLRPLTAGDTQAACDVTLSTTDQADPGRSSILRVANPGDPSTTHDFKYATPAEYAAYREGVLTWLMAE